MVVCLGQGLTKRYCKRAKVALSAAGRESRLTVTETFGAGSES